MTSKRDPGFDMIRAVSIALIVITHSTSILGFDDSTYLLDRCFYSQSATFGLAMFTMLAGALQMRSNYSIAEFYRKRFSRILVPFIFWSAIVYILSAITGKYENIDSVSDAIVQFIPSLLFNRINEAYWYVYLILILYAVTPLIQIVLARLRNPSSALISVLLLWIFIETVCPIKGQIGLVFHYLGFYLLGGVLDRYVKRTSRTSWTGIVCFLLIFCIGIAIPSILYIFPLQLACITGLYMGLAGIRPTSMVVSNFSRYGYTVYLTHFIFIRFLSIIFPGFFALGQVMPLVMMAIVIFAEYCFCMLLENCKFVPNRVVGI